MLSAPGIQINIPIFITGRNQINEQCAGVKEKYGSRDCWLTKRLTKQQCEDTFFFAMWSFFRFFRGKKPVIQPATYPNKGMTCLW